MPKRIGLTEVTESMVLAQPVLNQHGQLMLPAGSPITSRHITLLKMWGISSVVIESAEGEASPSELTPPPNVLLNCARRLTRRWPWRPRLEVERLVFQLAVLKLAKAAMQPGRE